MPNLDTLTIASLAMGTAGFLLTRLAVMRQPGQWRGRWYEDAALVCVLLMALWLAILDRLWPYADGSDPMAPGPALMLSVALGWGGMRSLEMIATRGRLIWRAATEKLDKSKDEAK